MFRPGLGSATALRRPTWSGKDFPDPAAMRLPAACRAIAYRLPASRDRAALRHRAAPARAARRERGVGGRRERALDVGHEPVGGLACREECDAACCGFLHRVALDDQPVQVGKRLAEVIAPRESACDHDALERRHAAHRLEVDRQQEHDAFDDRGEQLQVIAAADELDRKIRLPERRAEATDAVHEQRRVCCRRRQRRDAHARRR